MLSRLIPYVLRNIPNLNCKRAFRMDVLLQQNNEAQQTIQLLKDQLKILSGLADEQRRVKEKKEIEKLKVENAKLRAHAATLKNDLVYWESQNGYKSIPIPITARSQIPEPAAQKPQESKPSEAKTTNESSNVSATQGNQKKGKKDGQKNKEKGGGDNKAKGKGGPKDNADDEKPIDVSRLNMKIGKIVNVKKHPDADSLYVEEVDLGEERNRTIVSGLVKHVQIEHLQDRLAIFMVNLKPAKMRGILSEGMIMCASTPEKVEVLELPSGAQIGDRITFSGYPGEPDGQLNPKKKIWEQVQPDLRVDTNGVPCYKGTPFTIDGKGQCKAPSMSDCQIK